MRIVLLTPQEEFPSAAAILRGTGPTDTTDLTLALGVEMLRLGGVESTPEAARARLDAAIADGSGLAKLRQIIEAQHGDPAVVDDTSLLPQASATTDIAAREAAVIQSIDAFALGVAAMKLGAGRAKAEDRVDPAVGIEVLAHVGDRVDVGQPVARLHHNSDPAAVLDETRGAFVLGADPVPARPLVLGRID